MSPDVQPSSQQPSSQQPSSQQPSSQDLLEQASLLLEGVGLVPRERLFRAVVSGSDRVDYLHRMLTQDVAQLAPGRATYACLLTPKGRILGDLWVWNRGETLLIEMDADAQGAVMAVLEKYVIADDVVFEPESVAPARWSLMGPGAAAALTQAGLPVPALGCFKRATPDETALTVLNAERRGLPLYELVDPREGADLAATLGVAVCTPAAFDIVRTHGGTPVFGRELSDQVLFNEAGLEEAVAWGKGCFPGQEPVVMAKHRGHPPRLLVRLALSEAPQIVSGAALSQDGVEVGRLTSVAPALASHGAVALAYVRFAAAQSADPFDLEGGGRARILEPQ